MSMSEVISPGNQNSTLYLGQESSTLYLLGESDHITLKAVGKMTDLPKFGT
jgi:hypothetical protein